MKVLLVNPESPVTLLSLNHAVRFVSEKTILPPLGLLTVAAMLPTSWEKRLVDLATTDMEDRDILWADYVFVGGMDVQKESARQVINRCKKLGATVVGGGPLFTEYYETFGDVDHLVLGEAEVTLSPFLKDLEEGCPKPMYTPDRWADVHETPVPLWELIDVTQYGVLSVQRSRGCPNNCEFCDVAERFGRRVRTKTTAQVLNELERLYALGWRREVFFVDENFTGSNVKEDVLPAIIDWVKQRHHPFSFCGQVPISLADDEELLHLMGEAGFEGVFVGIETPCRESLAECNKVQNLNRDLVASVQKIQRSGMQVQGGFILGFDSDPPDIVDDLIQFIQQSGIVTAMVGVLYASPGTRLHERLAREDRLLESVYGDNKDFAINIIPKMGVENLVNGYQKVLRTIYSPDYYYARVRTFLKIYRPLHKAQNRPNWRDIRAFFRSIWCLGVIDEGRALYWKLFFWGLRHPRDLRLAIILAVLGFHFRRVVADSGDMQSFTSLPIADNCRIPSRKYGVVQAKVAPV